MSQRIPSLMIDAVSVLRNGAFANVQHFIRLNTRNALLIYTILFTALIHPFWLFGEVIVSYKLASEIGTPPAPTSSYIENRKFPDYWWSTVPAIRDHIQQPRSRGAAL
jgi:hypothetical protein